MSLCRNHLPEDPFARIDKYLIKDSSISWKAKGILCYAFSKPDKWQFYQKEIEKNASDGKESLKSGLEELQAAGYLHRLRINTKETGRFIYEWHWFSRPITLEDFQKSYPETGFPALVKPDTVNPAPNKNDCISKNERNNNPAAPAPTAVVVPSCLNNLKIQNALKSKIAREWTPDQIEAAVKRALNWKSRPADDVAVMTALRKADTWTDNLSEEDLESSNVEYLDTLQHLDGKMIGRTRVVTGRTYIEFVSGMNLEVFDVKQRDFKELVKNKIKVFQDLSKNN